MTRTITIRTLTTLAAAIALTCLVGPPVAAQAKKPAAKASVRAGAKMYQCPCCKKPMSLAAAKKKGLKCCGQSMVAVAAGKSIGKTRK